MGVDYDGIGGMGIEITDEMVEVLIASGKLTKEEWDEDPHSCLDDIGITFCEAGSYCYGGDRRMYWLVDGDNLDEVNANATEFIANLGKLGIILSTKDLVVIQDIHAW